MASKKISIQISVIIATANRSYYLQKLLESLQAQTYDHAKFEVIVVQNMACESVERVCSNFQLFFPYFTYIKQAGLACDSRNTGVNMAAGDIVAFIDDDAVAAPKWIQNIVQSFDIYGNKTACIGGPSHLIFEMKKPMWLSSWLLPFLGKLDYGTDSFILQSQQMLFGLNIAFKKQYLIKAGGAYSMATRGLARSGESIRISNNDYPMQLRLDQHGYERRYVPSVSVGHYVMPSRVRLLWFLQRLYAQGVGDARIYHLTGFRRHIIHVQPGSSIQSTIKKFLLLLLPTPAHMFTYIVSIAMLCGYYKERVLHSQA